MGWGDLLLASGKAKKLHQQTGDKICIGDGETIYWCDLYDGVPYLTKKPGRWYYSYPGNRGYYDPLTYEWILDYRAEPADIAFTYDELSAHTGEYVVIEPWVKPDGPLGKFWGLEKYQAVIDAFPEIEFRQPSYGAPMLKGVTEVKTTIRSAAALVANAKACVLPDGCLHHMAAATETPAVVIWGGFAPKQCLGYRMHRNLSWGPPIGFSMTREQALEAMENIPAIEVIRHLRELLYDG